jgi:uncharacterized protein YkuJ
MVDADPDISKPCVLREGSYFKGKPYYHSGGFLNRLILVEKKGNYSINGVKYSNVKIFEWNYLEEKKIFYWAKHIGLIRIEVYENDSIVSIRNLIKYNVKPYKK